jgi:5-methylcytosine-specific restriction enzyme subunit McrC
VRLVERRTREIRLPQSDVAYLLANARHLVDVVPAFRRGYYRITTRGYVGFFDTPTLRFAIQTKIPWPNVRMLLGLAESEHAAGVPTEPDSDLLNVLAREFIAQCRTTAQLGLVADYRDAETTSAFMRGKLRTADQMRDTASRAFPDRFHITESIYDLDTPWNRILRSVADSLLANPVLSPAVRSELQKIVISLSSVPLAEVSVTDFLLAEREQRVAHYRPLLALCRVLHDGLASAQVLGSGTGAFLIDLSPVFERYLTQSLAAKLASRTGWSVEAHPSFVVGPTILQPDILLRVRGKPRLVLDAKWKAPGTLPDAADLHQILAYSTLTGARHIGLIYPGRRFALREFAIAACDIRLSLLRVQVVGTTEECGASMSRLERFLGRKNRQR